MKLQFRKLRADEIDVRIANVKNNGVTLLLYKDARCDQNILDETVGSTGWQRHHTRENANCIVSIWDDDKQQWIEKEDTGTESYTEKEKGLASDSFKRACFNWGIGRELYTSPFIFFSAEKCNIENGKCYDRFSVSDIDYTGNAISMLVVKNEKTGAVFQYGVQGSKNVEQSDEPQQSRITAVQIGSITDLCVAYADMVTDKTAGDVLKILKTKFKFDNVPDLSEEKAKTVILQLKKWIEKQKEVDSE